MKTFGVMCPLFSLPSRYGIGSAGAEAMGFVDFLSSIGADAWQVLPLGPTGYGDSPYQAFSAFASSPYYIDLDMLEADGLLCAEELLNARAEEARRVQYGTLYEQRTALLERAYARYAERGEQAAFLAWKDGNLWSDEYAQFVALKAEFDGAAWTAWAEWAQAKSGQAYADFLKKSEKKRDAVKWQQYVFDGQWRALKSYAASKGIHLIGDMSIYVAMDSSDVWAHPEYFRLRGGVPDAVAGVPPDYFSATGQLWGNPLYDWQKMKEDGYEWWIARMERALEQYDAVRIDHFRGFSAYYAIPYGAVDAIGGHWEKGVGKDLFDAMTRRLGNLPIIAEDLGTLDKDVYDLLESLGYPGMKVLQFAFDDNAANPYLPTAHIPNCVVYTGTHDNPTTCEWAAKLTLEERRRVRVALKVSRHVRIASAVISAAIISAADTVILPIADILKKGAEARINEPSSLSERNWSWRMAVLPNAAVGRGWRRKIVKAKKHLNQV